MKEMHLPLFSFYIFIIFDIDYRTDFLNQLSDPAKLHYMEIIQAKDTDFIEILYLLKVCTLDMNRKGLTYWNSVYPGPDIIQEDLNNSSIYLVKDKESARAW
jgi:hypothetical protein